MQLPVETERTKARGVATILAHPGDDVVLELQKLRSWILTRGLHPLGRGSWTITDRPSSQVRHNVDRDDIETETVPQERAWLQAIPSQFVAKVQVPHAFQHHLDRVAGGLTEWATTSGYEIVGDPEVMLNDDPDVLDYEMILPLRRGEREDFIEVDLPEDE
jgi:hypothetical protein